MLVVHPVSNKTLRSGDKYGILLQKGMEDGKMPRYIVTLTDGEVQELKTMVQKGGKGYRIKHAQILLKLD